MPKLVFDIETSVLPLEGFDSVEQEYLFRDAGRLSDELARYILDLGFSERDKARMHDLAVRNQGDGLSPAEREELLAFGKAGDLLSILKSKARRTLGIA